MSASQRKAAHRATEGLVTEEGPIRVMASVCLASDLIYPSHPSALRTGVKGGQAHTGSFLPWTFPSLSPLLQWKKHWFVLTDSSLKYYRDSTAEEVRSRVGGPWEGLAAVGGVCGCGRGLWSGEPWWILLL